MRIKPILLNKQDDHFKKKHRKKIISNLANLYRKQIKTWRWKLCLKLKPNDSHMIKELVLYAINFAEIM